MFQEQNSFYPKSILAVLRVSYFHQLVELIKTFVLIYLILLNSLLIYPNLHISFLNSKFFDELHHIVLMLLLMSKYLNQIYFTVY
jgi:hypothetical protein